MGNIGAPEIAIVLIIALIVFGPKRLPELGKSLGNGLREFKSSISGDGGSDETHLIDNGVEEPPVEAEPTPVAAAKADAEAQTAKSPAADRSES